MSTSTAAPHPGMGFRQFVALMAGLMAINALAVDIMLPALPQIGESLGVLDHNRNQLIVTVYLLGLGLAQIVYGPLADRYGRKPVLLIGIVIYVVAAGLAACATSFEMLLMARALCGVGASATRVLSVSIIRDCYAGRRMAQVMSLAFIVFLAVPILAPSLGQLIMLTAPWRWIFGSLAIYGFVIGLWTWIKLPETMHPEDRRPLSATALLGAFRTVVTERGSIGYMLAMTCVLGGLYGFISSSQQIFVDIFDAAALFPILFAAIAGAMAASSLLNARVVDRLGMRRVSHSALVGFTLISALHASVALSGAETLWTFAILQGAMMFCFGLVTSNFGSIAMEPLGHLAGMGASVQGFITTLGGATLGYVIGQLFDGTTVPLTLGYTVLGLAALLIVLVAEQGRLFRSGGPRRS